MGADAYQPKRQGAAVQTHAIERPRDRYRDPRTLVQHSEVELQAALKNVATLICINAFGQAVMIETIPQ